MKVLAWFTHVGYALWPAKPRLVSFDYSRVIVADQPYLLFSWASKGAAYLAVKTIGFKSYHRRGSAYVLINNSTDSLRLSLGNYWRKIHIDLPLMSLTGDLLSVRIKRSFDELSVSQVYQPKIKTTLSNLKLQNTWNEVQVTLPDLHIIQPQFVH